MLRRSECSFNVLFGDQVNVQGENDFLLLATNCLLKAALDIFQLAFRWVKTKNTTLNHSTVMLHHTDA